MKKNFLILNKIKLKGYSLIELMVVLAIAAGLGITAVSQYRSYAIDTKFAGILLVMESVKPQIENYIHNNNAIPISNATNIALLTGKLSSPYVISFGYEGGFGITALVNSVAIGFKSTNSGFDKLYMSPHPNTASTSNWTHIVWTCGSFDRSLDAFVPSCSDAAPASEWTPA